MPATVVERSMLTRRLAVGALCVAAFASSALAALAPDTNKISETNLRAHLTFVAHDLMEGRDTPSRGLDITAQYIAAQLTMYGVQPGGVDGTYFQPIKLSGAKLKADATTLTISGKSFVLGEDFMPRGLKSAEVQGTPIFIASGYTNLKKDIDPFKGYSVKGAIVVTDGSLPQGVTMRDVFSSEDWESPEQAAARNGAAAVILISNSSNTASWKRQVDRMTEGGRLTPSNDSQVSIASVMVSKTVGDTLVGSIMSAGRAEFATMAPVVKLTLGVEQQEAITQNVIGIIPGSDPKQKAEYIALGAHYDHVGIGRADANGDTIYNGADDDGSGTVALIEIARVIAAGNKPKRSIIFVWHTGEEKGLWGSQYFAANPTIDLKNLVLQINLDMIGMAKQPGDTNPANARLTDGNGLFVIGPRIVSSDITQTVNSVNASVDNMTLDPYYDRLDDPERIFYRSDHYSYIAKGVPAVFFFSGSHAHYHRPSDEISVIDFKKYTKSVRLMYALAYEFASQTTRPKIDGPVRNVLPNLGGGLP
ncbi:MAG: M20/M25/M40 family metallo-hydrolase [Fimbriimonadaceae bacterium]|nr:M20/M25/M40 family metallo-hydrolase [Fimbriimonadaceae bacterium]